MSRERRRHHRARMIGEVNYKAEKKQSFGGCIAKDVSESGVCIKIDEFFPVGSVLDLQFKLPLSSTAFYVQGKIMWINKMPYNEQWEAGLEIIKDKSYGDLVKKYISAKMLERNSEYTE
jgi:Tfp pilus assembly protein PilZ